MTWVKLPDDALEDPKVADLNDAAILDYLKALGWSNRWARDGAVPVAKAGHWVEDWVTAGLATVDDDVVHLSWLLEHQPKADEIEKRKKDAAERQERHRRHMASDHSKCDPKRCHALVTRDKTRDKRTLLSDPSRPDPSLPERGGEETDDGAGTPEAPAVVPQIQRRRQLAKAIRESTDDLLRQRYRRTFEKQFGALYGRQVAS